MRNGTNGRAAPQLSGEPCLAPQLVGAAVAAPLGADCSAAPVLLEPVTAHFGLFGPKVRIHRNFSARACAKADSKIC